MVLKTIPVLFFWGVFLFVVLQIPYPDSFIQANLGQLLPFFISLFLALALTLNIILQSILISGSTSLGLIFLLILKALDSFNLVTAALVAVIMYLLISYFRKIKRNSWEIRRIREVRGIRGKRRNRV